MLVKNCVPALRDTNAGEIAVVVNHSQPSNGVSELFTLIFFYQSASSAALTVSQFFDITEPTALDTQKRDRAVARAKLTTPPLNKNQLRGGHADYKKDLLERRGVPEQRADADGSAEAVLARSLFGRVARVQL